MDRMPAETRGILTLNAAQMKKLKAETGIAEMKDLLDWALTMLRWSAKEAKKGRVIASLDESTGKYRELQMPFLAELKKRSESQNGQ